MFEHQFRLMQSVVGLETKFFLLLIAQAQQISFISKTSLTNLSD